MSEPQRDEPRGPNLIVLYTIMVIAFAVAIVIAGFIVAPFYLHRR